MTDSLQYNIPLMMEQARSKNDEQWIYLSMALSANFSAFIYGFINKEELDKRDKEAFEQFKPRGWREWLQIQNNEVSTQ